LIVSYDFTLLVEASPPRHTVRKRVITAVTGVVELAEEAALVQMAHIRLPAGFERRMFVSPEGRVYAHVGSLSPELFKDGEKGLPFISRYRADVESALSQTLPSARRSQFYPGNRIESPTVFSRVDPVATGATAEELTVVDRERELVERNLSHYVYSDGEVFLSTQEPFLVVWKNAKTGAFTLTVEADLRNGFWETEEIKPLACFRVGEEKKARDYVASFTPGVRPRVKGDGCKVSEIDRELLTVDAAAMTLRAAGLRIRENFLGLAEQYGTIGEALDELPLEEIALFRRLSEAVTRRWTEIDGIDDAVQACLDYENGSGRKVFSWDYGGADSLGRCWRSGMRVRSGSAVWLDTLGPTDSGGNQEADPEVGLGAYQQ
jgi:hypothetical protein